jgi:hypothetical protein
MHVKRLDGANLGQGEDWEGNNAAFACPACGKVFIVSGVIHRGERRCPVFSCGKAVAYVEGGRQSGGKARIEWSDL